MASRKLQNFLHESIANTSPILHYRHGGNTKPGLHVYEDTVTVLVLRRSGTDLWITG